MVMCEDGKAEDSRPRAPCADEPNLDDASNKRKRALKKFPSLIAWRRTRQIHVSALWRCVR